MQTIDYTIITVGLVLIISTISEAIASTKKAAYKSSKEENIEELQKRIMALEEKLGIQPQMPTDTVQTTQE
ncbi:MAG: hypothetical protein WC667_12985 [Sulfurimonas sp.]|jgi:hypothetical protein